MEMVLDIEHASCILRGGICGGRFELLAAITKPITITNPQVRYGRCPSTDPGFWIPWSTLVLYRICSSEFPKTRSDSRPESDGRGDDRSLLNAECIATSLTDITDITRHHRSVESRNIDCYDVLQYETPLLDNLASGFAV